MRRIFCDECKTLVSEVSPSEIGGTETVSRPSITINFPILNKKKIWGTHIFCSKSCLIKYIQENMDELPETALFTA